MAVSDHQRLKHAAAGHSMRQHLFWGAVGGGFEAYRSMPQHTENLVGIFWEKISDQNMNPIAEQVFVRDGQYSNGQTVHL